MTNPTAQDLGGIVNFDVCPILDAGFRTRCRQTIDDDGVLVLSEFLDTRAVESVRKEGLTNAGLAYYAQSDHNVFLAPNDPQFADDHARNRRVVSSKGCITTDQIPDESALKALYDSSDFREFLCDVLGETELHEYADDLSSINLHYARDGQELGWHFDNSSFAITLMIQRPIGGGEFEYVRDVRHAASGENNYATVADVLDGKIQPRALSMEAGTLVLFRGQNAMHRVTPAVGNRDRMLVVLAYNVEPGIPLSESARMTFYGRL